MIIGGTSAVSSSSSSHTNANLHSREKKSVSTPQIFDPFFGIKVSSPRLTLDTFSSYCQELQKVKLNSIGSPSAPNGENLTMGVIVESSGMKKSANGKEYILWQLSDLSDLKVKVLLFGDAASAHWKIPIGYVVALTNAEQMSESNGNVVQPAVTLKINKSLQVLNVGSCPDFGICRGTKKNGEQCTNYVNAAFSPMCSFHIQYEAKKLLSNRSLFSSTVNVRNALFKPQTDPQPSGLVTVNRPRSMQQMISRVQYTTGDRATIAAKARNEQRAHLKLEVDKENRPNSTIKTIPKPEIKATTSFLKGFMDQKNKTEVIRNAVSRVGPPQLGRAVQHGNLISLTSPKKIETKPQFSKAEDAARKKAAEIFKKSLNSNGKTVKRKAPSDDPEGEKRCRLNASKFSNNQIRALLDKKSTHDFEVTRAKTEHQEKYFKQKEFEEKIETHATTLMEVKEVSVVTCKSCSYTTVHLAQRCIDLNHDFVRHKATKRFFKCKQCHTRTTCFSLMPTKPCIQCSSRDFERVAMKDERKVEIREKLLVRGEERTFVNK
ncbi:Protein MCM10-like protein [Aphelenchoides besseyi]|nr:Protein MCM10-like protein [Aphelenchoides besseyi]